MSENSVALSRERIGEESRKTADYHVERIETAGALRQLEKSWTSLLERVATPAVFLTWEWITTWWQHYGNEHDLWLLTARDRRNGRLAGVAPWMHTRLGSSHVHVRALSFIGRGIVYPAHLDLIAGADERDDVAAAFVDYLAAHEAEWDLVDFNALADDSPVRHLLAERARCYEGGKGVCPFISLPAAWEAYEGKALRKSFRKKLGRYHRRLERDYPEKVRFVRVTEQSQIAPAMDAMVTLQQKRWSAQGRTTPFDSARFVAFHQEMAAVALKNGWLRLYQLQVDGDVVAMNYCFCYRHIYYGYQKSFDTAWGKYSPGRILQVHVIQEAIAEGAVEFDMLHGGGGGKNDWTDQRRADRHLLAAHNWRGQLWLSGAALAEQALSLGKRSVPASWQRQVERVLFEQRHQAHGS